MGAIIHCALHKFIVPEEGEVGEGMTMMVTMMKKVK